MPAWLAPVVGALGSIGNSLIGARTQKLSDRRQNKANMAMAEYAYSKDLEMWRRQNEYNSPREQMKRFGEAGLNPNLIYGQGTPGNASQMAKYQAPRMEYNDKPPIDLNNTLDQYMNMQMKEAQIDNVKAQTNQTEAQTATEMERTLLTNLQHTNLDQKVRREARVLGQFLKDPKYAQAENDKIIAGLKDVQKRTLATQLRNQYQKEVNRMIKVGITPGDGLKIRVLYQLMQKLNADTSWLDGAMQQLIKK